MNGLPQWTDVPPEVLARFDAMEVRAQELEALAKASAAALMTLHARHPEVKDAIFALWDVVALEVARCRALGVGDPPPSIEQALSRYGIAPNIEGRVAANQSIKGN